MMGCRQEQPGLSFRPGGFLGPVGATVGRGTGRGQAQARIESSGRPRASWGSLQATHDPGRWVPPWGVPWGLSARVGPSQGRQAQGFATFPLGIPPSASEVSAPVLFLQIVPRPLAAAEVSGRDLGRPRAFLGSALGILYQGRAKVSLR